MAKIIMNEVEHVKELLKSGNIEVDTHRNISLLGRYYANNKNDKKEIISLLCEYMKKNKDEYLEEKWIDYIEKVADRESKSDRTLRDIKEVWITQSEKDIIYKLKKSERHIVFTLISLAKIFDNGSNTGWVTLNSSDIFGVCGKTWLSSKKQDEILFRLKEFGLISYAKKINNLNIKVECMDYSSDNIWRVNKIEKLNIQCDSMFNVLNNGYKLCEECGVESFKPKNKSPQKYCSKCYSSKHKEHNRNYMNKIRKC